MKFIKYLIFLCFVTGPLPGMQAPFSQNKAYIDMNQGAGAHVPKESSYKIGTDRLAGCVVTLIDIEHTNGDHSICMCHCSYDYKKHNKQVIDIFLQKQNLNTIKRASCILLPPGINKKRIHTTIIPIFDPEWKNMIISTIQYYIPTATITIKPYLFNELASSVHYSFDSGKTSLEIINGSTLIDEESKNLLLETHNYETEDSQFKAAIIPAIVTALAGFYLYCLTK